MNLFIYFVLCLILTTPIIILGASILYLLSQKVKSDNKKLFLTVASGSLLALGSVAQAYFITMSVGLDYTKVLSQYYIAIAFNALVFFLAVKSNKGPK